MRRLLPLLLAFCLLLAACGTMDPAPSAEPAPAPTPIPTPVYLSPAPEHPHDPLPVYIDGLLSMRGCVRGGVAYLPPEPICVYYGLGYETSWDRNSFTMRLPGLDIAGRDGQPYITADGRYLYTPDGWFQADGFLYLPADAVERLLGVTVTLADDLSRADLSGTGCRLLRGGEDYYARTTQADDLFWLIHIIYSEAHHESLAGQIGVGNVVLNRIASSRFPNTVKDVVFEPGQFTPVDNGSIYNTPSSEAVRAAQLCLQGVNTVGYSMFFLNPSIADASWFNSALTYYTTIGGHAFYI